MYTYNQLMQLTGEYKPSSNVFWDHDHQLSRSCTSSKPGIFPSHGSL